jgi:lauroyl/myristoyl acyltransferase
MRIQSIFLTCLYVFLVVFFWLIPRRILLWLCSMAAGCLQYFPLHPIDRNLNVLNRYRELKGDSLLPLRKLKRRNLYYTMKNVVDFFKFLILKRKGWEEKIRVEGLENLKSVYDQGKGVIGVCGHLGNWEIGGLVLQKHQIKVSSLIFEQLDPLLDLFLNKAREDSGVQLLHQRRGLRQAIRNLEAGGLVCVHTDQDGTRHGNFLNFFGLHCSFPRVIEMFLNHSEPAIVPMCLFHDPDSDGYCLKFFEPWEIDYAQVRSDVTPVFEKIRDFLQDEILENPDQWLLLYDRFKLRHIPLLRKQGVLERVQKEFEEAWKGRE